MMASFNKKAYDKRHYKQNRSKILRRMKKYRNKNRKRINRQIRIWYHKGKWRFMKKVWRWMQEYGLTPEQVRSLFRYQKGRCAVCGARKSVEGRWDTLNIDHEHNRLKRVRGLLCTLCNRILGALERRPKVLKQCVPFQKYLNSPPAKKLKIGGWQEIT
jgi:hypothetical protein